MNVDVSVSKKRRLDSNSVECVVVPNKRARHERGEASTANKRRKKNTKNPLALITPPDLSQFAICWIKVRGFKDWSIEQCVNGKYVIHFFGDYTFSQPVSRNKITNFYEGFSIFKHTFDDPKLIVLLSSTNVRSRFFNSLPLDLSVNVFIFG